MDGFGVVNESTLLWLGKSPNPSQGVCRGPSKGLAVRDWESVMAEIQLFPDRAHQTGQGFGWDFHNNIMPALCCGKTQGEKNVSTRFLNPSILKELKPQKPVDKEQGGKGGYLVSCPTECNSTEMCLPHLTQTL